MQERDSKLHRDALDLLYAKEAPELMGLDWIQSDEKKEMDMRLGRIGVKASRPFIRIAARFGPLAHDKRRPLCIVSSTIKLPDKSTLHPRRRKVRTMVLGAQNLASTCKDRLGTRRDPRILNRWCNLIRMFSLDELPQFKQLLNGELTLVGPRGFSPHAWDEIIANSDKWPYREFLKHVHEVRWGITGLSQVLGRKTLTLEQQVELNLLYMRLASREADMRILRRTVRAVLLPRGAY